MPPKKKASTSRKRGNDDAVAGPSNAKRQRTNIEGSPRNSPALEDEKDLEIQALKSQIEQLQNDNQGLEHTRETDQQRLAELESTREIDQQRLAELETEIDRLRDENAQLTEENDELKQKQERVEALGGIDELEEEQRRIETLGGLDQLEEEQERIETLGGLNQLEEEHELIERFDDFETAQRLYENTNRLGGLEAFEETVTWLEEIFGDLEVAQRFLEKIHEYEDLDILEEDHDWVQSLGGLETASSTYEHAIDNHDAMIEQLENQNRHVEDLEWQSRDHQRDLLELERLKQLCREMHQERLTQAGDTLAIHPTTLPSTDAYVFAILEAAKQSIKKQMTKSRACNSTEPWYHWSFCPSEAVFRSLFGTNARRHQINWWELEQMLGGEIRVNAIARGYVHLCGQVDILWKPREMIFKMSGFCG